ncbi:hypothetical protein [Vibrio harveyi]|uniref:hypothetical protein n=1 Tax=Vibrio harveyi TaxID=669 RepID=UPI002480ADB0|nr:hypothetical protein [Vibrio harveyi]
MNFKALACKITLFLCLITPPSLIQAFGLVWVIQDPARDMNWELKTIKKYLILAEKKLANIDKMLGEQLLSQYQMLKEEANKSALIRATTSSLSITQNTSAENRYAPTATGLVCSIIAANNRTETCEVVNHNKTHDIRNLELRFLDPQRADATYYRNVMLVNNLDYKANEKDTIKALVFNIDDYSEVLNSYRLINQSDYDKLTPITDLIFDWEVTLPTPNEIVDHPTAIRAEMFKQAFDASTAKSFVSRSLKERTQNASMYAKDATVIQSGTNEYLEKLLDDLANSTMSEDTLRLLAVTKVKQLQQQFKQLEVNLRNNSAAAIKLKQLTEIQAKGRL